MENSVSTEAPKPAEPRPPVENGVSNHVNGLDKSGSSSSHKHSSSSHKHSSGSSSHKSSSSSHRHSSSSHKPHSSSGSSHKDKHSSSSKSGSSSSGHKHSSHHSSSSSGKHRESGSGSSSSHKHHSSSSSGDPAKHSSSSSKHPSSSSSSKHPSSSSSSKHPSSSSKHHSSSSSSKDKHHSSSSSSHKHRDGSSSGSKHHSSEHKHRDGDKSKHSSSHGSEKNKENHEKSVDQPDGKERGKIASPEHIKQDVGSPPAFKEELYSPVKSEPLSPTKVQIKKELKVDSDDDVPLSTRYDKVKSEPKAVKRFIDDNEEDDDDIPLSSRAEKIMKQKVKVETSPVKDTKKRKASLDDDFVPNKKKKPAKTPVQTSPTKKGKKPKKEEEVKWKWWEEERKEDGAKWRSLEHKGPQFALPYEPLPDRVKFFYNGKEMKLTTGCEEVATFYARMLEHDYTTKDMFNANFFKDWKKTMSREEREKITDLKLCDFRQMAEWFKLKTEERKAMSKEEKNVIKEQNAALLEEYGYCIIDGHKQKIGNFRIEPPGLFRGRGDHPKQGMLKKRTMPEDVIINCSKDAKVPPAPDGHKWKEVRHDNSVTWLACWSENVQGSTKYVMLNAASKLKGEKDWQKYETARNLHSHVDKIRAQYREDWKSKEMRLRQRSVAMYFIDKLALRAGNEKDEDQADTVGCCSLRVEHLKLYEQLQDKEFVVEFDFLGKDSIRYFNQVPVEKRVFKNLQLFMDNKNTGDDLFDRLNTGILNKHLQSLMNGLTAKVFRTFNASKTLQDQLDLLTNEEDPLPTKLLAYNRANRAVAVLCNHQRAVPKNFDKQMENLQIKLDKKRDEVRNAKKELKQAKSDHKTIKNERTRKMVEKRKKAIERFQNQLTNIEVQATDKDENKEIALGTSKLNYLDPRISIAWCKKWEVPVEKIYNKTQREKFAWAIDMAEDDFRF